MSRKDYRIPTEVLSTSHWAYVMDTNEEKCHRCRAFASNIYSHVEEGSVLLCDLCVKWVNHETVIVPGEPKYTPMHILREKYASERFARKKRAKERRDNLNKV